MAKNYFLNQAKSFTSESQFSQLHGNANKKTRKLRYFFQGVMKRKMQEKNKDKIEARFAERKQKMNSLKIKFKRKLDNMEQVQMEY